MTLLLLPQAFTICKVESASDVDITRGFVFFAKTDEEFSLVCETEHTPEGALAREPGWRAFRVEGVLDFGMTGVLSALSGLLAKANISLFAVSTYNTDYILVKEEDVKGAAAAFQSGGFFLGAI